MVQINTFQCRDELGRVRSLTNLTLHEDERAGSEAARLFQASRSPTDLASSLYEEQRSRRPTPRGYAPSENDRSLGSTAYRAAEHSPYELEDDRSTVSTSVSAGSTTFRAAPHPHKEFTMV